MDRFEQRLREVPWEEFETAYGSARRVPEYLWAVRFSCEEDALKACDALWANLCHQHAYISSAALPAFPFLLESLKTIQSDEVREEILDILWGFALCSRGSEVGWVKKVFVELSSELPFFSELLTDANELIAEGARLVVGALNGDPDCN